MNLRGEALRVGDVIHREQRPVAREVIDFYADTFGDHHRAYSGEGDGDPALAGPVAPPLLYHSEVYSHVDRWYLKNLVGNLHTRQEWFLFAPLRPGTNIQTRSTLVDRYRKRDRDILVNEVDYSDESGRLLVRGRTHQSFLAERAEAEDGFVVDRDSQKRKKGSAGRPGQGDGAEIEPFEICVDPETCWRFSGPGRNYHNDVEQARKFGFPEIVVQGLLSTCLLSQIMGNTFGGGWFAGGRMDVRLVNVLWGGETVRARGKLVSEQTEGSYTRRTLEVWVEKVDEAQTVVTVGTASALV
ncbi:MAG: MaoC family dehydratase [bacterium]|nr:MaoC family dehydratase [bacterium]